MTRRASTVSPACGWAWPSSQPGETERPISPEGGNAVPGGAWWDADATMDWLTRHGANLGSGAKDRSAATDVKGERNAQAEAVRLSKWKGIDAYAMVDLGTRS